MARLTHTVHEACLSSLEFGGPLLRSPVCGVSVHVHRIVVGGDDAAREDAEAQLRIPSSQSAITALIPLLRSATMAAVRDALTNVDNWRLMEPVMDVELYLPFMAGEVF